MWARPQFANSSNQKRQSSVEGYHCLWKKELDAVTASLQISHAQRFISQRSDEVLSGRTRDAGIILFLFQIVKSMPGIHLCSSTRTSARSAQYVVPRLRGSLGRQPRLPAGVSRNEVERLCLTLSCLCEHRPRQRRHPCSFLLLFLC